MLPRGKTARLTRSKGAGNPVTMARYVALLRNATHESPDTGLRLSAHSPRRLIWHEHYPSWSRRRVR